MILKKHKMHLSSELLRETLAGFNRVTHFMFTDEDMATNFLKHQYLKI